MARNTPRTTRLARTLRRNSTPAETEFWKLLRERQLDGWRFRRQHIMGPCIVDFVCLEHKVVVELDGVHHEGDEQRERDLARDIWLAASGYTVVRIDNGVATGAPDLALERIRSAKRRS